MLISKNKINNQNNDIIHELYSIQSTPNSFFNFKSKVSWIEIKIIKNGTILNLMQLYQKNNNTKCSDNVFIEEKIK